MVFIKGFKHSEETKLKIRKNNPKYWLGKKRSAETIKKLSIAHTGKKHSKEQNEKMRQWMLKNNPFKGKKHKAETLAKITGENSKKWKGEKVSYREMHKWVAKNLGKPSDCSECGKIGLSGRKIHWANISRKYKRDLNDWARLCVPCHWKHDGKIRNSKGQFVS